MKSAQTPIPTPSESVTITLTLKEFELLFNLSLGGSQFERWIPNDRDLTLTEIHLLEVRRFHKKLIFLKPYIGDACRHSAHIPEATGQGGTQ